MVGAANLLPGPSSTELAIYIGYSRAGWRGLVLAGACFIIPAMLMVGALAALYVRFGSLPEVSGVLYGVKPVVIAVVLQALWGLGRASINSWALAIVSIVAAGATIIGAPQLIVLASAGLAVMMVRGVAGAGAAFAGVPFLAPAAAGRTRWAVTTGAVASSTASASAFGLWPLFLVFLEVGAVLFGSGYVLLAFLRADLVQRLGWLSERQLLDAVAVGQITPGPVFTTATFIGYVLGGTPGALVATVGIFLPSFLLVALSGPVLPRLRASPRARAFLGRCDRRLTLPDGGGDLASGPGGPDRRAHGGARRTEPDAAAPLSRQLELAGPRGGRRRADVAAPPAISQGHA